MIKHTGGHSQSASLTRNTQARLSKIRVLVADHDARTASLVHGVLISFGFKHVEVVHKGDEAIAILQEKEIDMLITEWELRTTNGIRLVKAIRGTKSGARWSRELPAIMLTAKADIEAVREARDAGFTEFVTKPFSARSLSARLLQMIDHPRAFVISESYIGPCRRRRNQDRPGQADRRRPFNPRDKSENSLSEILPPNKSLARLIGEDITGQTIFTEQLIEHVQKELLKKESQFIEWAQDDIRVLEQAYHILRTHTTDPHAREDVLAAAYRIKSQAGMFGYDMGTEVGRMLLDYLEKRVHISQNCLTILRMHIDTIKVVFQKKIKDSQQEVAAELLKALQVLVLKLTQKEAEA